MNRNSNAHFSLAPQVNIERSKFDRSCKVITSMNVGEIVPFFVDEILPGDTFKVKTSKIARMQTLKTPMMDDLFLDTYYFFVPNRLIWTHWRQFMGENTESAWIPETTYSVPQLTSPSGGWNVGTIADYMGIPTGVSNLSVNALPFRAYALIMNEWMRSENLQDPLTIQTGDSTVAGVNTGNFVTDVCKGGLPYIACKTMDYFTACLPSPQKGPAVEVALTSGGDTVPVYTIGEPNSMFSMDNGQSEFYKAVSASYPIMYENQIADYSGIATDTDPVPHPFVDFVYASATNSTAVSGDKDIYHWETPADEINGYDVPLMLGKSNQKTGWTAIGKKLSDYPSDFTNWRTITPINLVAATNHAYTTINELRTAFQIQRFYEKQARGGSRYIEQIRSHFGVSSPDARMMRPEYLGGNRINLNIRQITQTSSTTDDSPLGDVAGMSVTTDQNYDFNKSFTEHGWIIGIMVARYNHTYQQGIERQFSRKTMFDYYWPSLSHIGEQAVLNKELYAQGTDTDNEVFGYQEAWAEYRYKPNKVTGMMRSAANTALDTWHLGDDYDSLPYLSASWIVEDKANVDRVLQVSSDVANQIFADIWVDCEATRPMPLYSIPGLIDHF